MARLIDVENLKGFYEPYKGLDVPCEEVCRQIDSQPTVDAVEVVHGEWIYKGTTNGKMIFECSNCKSLIAGRGRFCKECGAKMDGGEKKWTT